MNNEGEKIILDNPIAIRKKRIGINFIANCVSFVIQLIISFIMTPIIIRSVGKEIYGFYPISTNIVTYMSIVTTALNALGSRYITIALAKNDIEDAKKYFSSLFTVNIILTTILILPTIFVILYLDKILNIPFDAIDSIKVLFSLVLSSALINIVSNVFGVATFAKNRIDLRSIREIIASIIKLILFVLFYYFLNSSIIYVGVV